MRERIRAALYTGRATPDMGGTVADIRFDEPLYTLDEAAFYLRVPASTFRTWALGYEWRSGERTVTAAPVITAILDARPRRPRVPFIGLAEGMVAAAFRHAGVSMQHIRKALPILAEEIGIEHALASRRLYTDGAAILYDYGRRDEEFAQLAEVVGGQRVFAGAIVTYLQRIEYAADGWAERLYLPLGVRPVVQADPQRAFGRPIFVHGAAPMQDVLDRFQAGEPLAEVAADFGVPSEDVEEAIRALLPHAA